MDGRCTCGAVRYRLTRPPMFVMACHCTWCQRETGSAFAVIAEIETVHVEHLTGEVDEVQVPSPSGLGQTVCRCRVCKVALWSHYGGAGRADAFVRVGTLLDPGQCPPQLHIYTSTKLPWVVLDGTLPAIAENHGIADYWSAESLAREKVMNARG